MSQPKLPFPAAALFDLDGTLVDTVPDIAAAADAACVALGLPARGEAAVRLWVGNGAEVLLHRVLTGRLDGQADPALVRRGLTLFKEAYARAVFVRSRVCDGVPACLCWLRARGVRLGVVTNKPGALTTPVLARAGLAGFFGVVLGGDALPQRKPDPTPLRVAAERLSAAAGPVLVVGDSGTDVQAARNAGYPVVCVTYGYNHGADIRAAGADALVDSLAELPALLAAPPAPVSGLPASVAAPGRE